MRTRSPTPIPLLVQSVPGKEVNSLVSSPFCSLLVLFPLFLSSIISVTIRLYLFISLVLSSPVPSRTTSPSYIQFWVSLLSSTSLSWGSFLDSYTFPGPRFFFKPYEILKNPPGHIISPLSVLPLLSSCLRFQTVFYHFSQNRVLVTLQ